MRLAIRTIFLLASVASLDAQADGPAAPVSPAEQWETVADPAALGYSSKRLDGVRDLLRTMNTTGLMVVVSGRVLLQHGDVVQTSPLFSARKSITSMLLVQRRRERVTN